MTFRFARFPPQEFEFERVSVKFSSNRHRSDLDEESCPVDPKVAQEAYPSRRNRETELPLRSAGKIVLEAQGIVLPEETFEAVGTESKGIK